METGLEVKAPEQSNGQGLKDTKVCAMLVCVVELVPWELILALPLIIFSYPFFPSTFTPVYSSSVCFIPHLILYKSHYVIFACVSIPFSYTMLLKLLLRQLLLLCAAMVTTANSYNFLSMLPQPLLDLLYKGE